MRLKKGLEGGQRLVKGVSLGLFCLNTVEETNPCVCRKHCLLLLFLLLVCLATLNSKLVPLLWGENLSRTLQPTPLSCYSDVEFIFLRKMHTDLLEPYLKMIGLATTYIFIFQKNNHAVINMGNCPRCPRTIIKSMAILKGRV